MEEHDIVPTSPKSELTKEERQADLRSRIMEQADTILVGLENAFAKHIGFVDDDGTPLSLRESMREVKELNDRDKLPPKLQKYYDGMGLKLRIKNPDESLELDIFRGGFAVGFKYSNNDQSIEWDMHHCQKPASERDLTIVNNNKKNYTKKRIQLFDIQALRSEGGSRRLPLYMEMIQGESRMSVKYDELDETGNTRLMGGAELIPLSIQHEHYQGEINLSEGTINFKVVGYLETYKTPKATLEPDGNTFTIESGFSGRNKFKIKINQNMIDVIRDNASVMVMSTAVKQLE